MRQLESGKISAEKAQAIIEGRVKVLGKRDLVKVPDLTTTELIALMEKSLKLTYLSNDFAKTDFVKADRGKVFEVEVWKPGYEVVPVIEVRDHFTDGFVGNTAAFAAWLIKHNPEGFYASIPEDERLFSSWGYFCTPNFCRDQGGCKLNLVSSVRDTWREYWSFLAFREIAR